MSAANLSIMVPEPGALKILTQAVSIRSTIVLGSKAVLVIGERTLIDGPSASSTQEALTRLLKATEMMVTRYTTWRDGTKDDTKQYEMGATVKFEALKVFALEALAPREGP